MQASSGITMQRPCETHRSDSLVARDERRRDDRPARALAPHASLRVHSGQVPLRCARRHAIESPSLDMLAAARAAALRTSARRLCTRTGEAASDYFALLQTERRFDLDAAALQRAYRRLMADLHPDRHSGAGERVQSEAADRAAEVTHAYAILKAEHSRATHLLELHGAPLTEENGAELLPPDFLLRVMEVREELEAGAADLARLRAENDAATRDVGEALADAFSQGRLDEARSLTAQLQYLTRIEREVVDLSDV